MESQGLAVQSGSGPLQALLVPAREAGRETLHRHGSPAQNELPGEDHRQEEDRDGSVLAGRKKMPLALAQRVGFESTIGSMIIYSWELF